MVKVRTDSTDSVAMLVHYVARLCTALKATYEVHDFDSGIFERKGVEAVHVFRSQLHRDDPEQAEVRRRCRCIGIFFVIL